MFWVRIHHAQQNFGHDAAAERPKAFAAAKSANSENLRFAQEIVPKRCFLVQTAVPKKFVAFVVESDLRVSKRLQTRGSTCLLGWRQTDSRSAEKGHLRQWRRRRV